MSVVWPEKFTPQVIGQPTKLNLPGVSTRSALQIATVAPGVTVTRSRFLELDGRVDIIKRHSDTILVIFGRQGTMSLKCLASGQAAETQPGDCWLLHPSSRGVERRIPSNAVVSSFVVSVRRDQVSQTLQDATEAFVNSGDALASVKPLTCDANAFSSLFNHNVSATELLQLEAHCLTIVAEAFAAHGSNAKQSIEAQITAFLQNRLAEKITLDHVARHVGMNRTKLNATLRAESAVTVFELMRRLRVAKAKNLRAAGKPLSQIAEETGFSSASHLCRVLKESD